jgi:hypothetical protein
MTWSSMGKSPRLSKLAHCPAGDDQTVDKYPPAQLEKKTTVVHVALLAGGACKPRSRLPLVQLTVLPQVVCFGCIVAKRRDLRSEQ